MRVQWRRQSSALCHENRSPRGDSACDAPPGQVLSASCEDRWAQTQAVTLATWGNTGDRPGWCAEAEATGLRSNAAAEAIDASWGVRRKVS